MEPALYVLGFAALMGLAVAMMAWHFRRSRSIAEEWAQANGFELLEAERRLAFRGPFWWRTSKGQEVFRITVRDARGNVRSGYLRVGGWFLGLLSDQGDVEWDRD